MAIYILFEYIYIVFYVCVNVYIYMSIKVERK